MKIRYLYLSALLAFLLFAAPSSAEPKSELERLHRLQPNERQVQEIFSLFLSRVPYILSDSADSRQLIEDMAPQALQLLDREQRDFLQQLAPQEQSRRFGEMTRNQRTQYVFNAAKSLVHPSERVWLQRMEEMVETAPPEQN